MKSKILLKMFLVILISSTSFASDGIGLTQESYIALCGVWDFNKDFVGQEEKFSWGKATAIINNSIVIDLGEDSPFFLAGDLGQYNIIKVNKKNDTFIITIRRRDNSEYNYKISIIDDKTIFFNQTEQGKKVPLLDKYGKENKYYKLSGPTIKYKKLKIEKLRLRIDPSLNSKIVRNLNKEDKLIIIKTGKEEIIEGNKGNWVKVITGQNEIGWCFNNYLEDK